MKIALYKATHTGIAGLYNRVVRWWDQGPYSHCEVIFTDGMSASSSFMDKGVRFKEIVYDEAKWDYLEVPAAYELAARHWFLVHAGQPYNLIGNARFAFGFIKNPMNKWFCSEAVGASLGIKEPWRLSPNGLAAILVTLNK
jgi:hypothetical protein